MLTSSGAISNIKPAKTYFSTTEKEELAQVSHEPSYDSLTISSSSEERSFHMQLVSRLSQEVRTSVTTGDVQRLKQEVSSGQYTPDPMAIAARMLFLTEEA
jgi:anti-sigma28 factor (negative regulator of flagellin synthesis)